MKNLEDPDDQPNGRSWEEFFKEIEIRDQYDQVTYYGDVNVNYIVFPTNEFIMNYGVNGRNLMNDVKAKGWQTVLNDLKQQIQRSHEVTQDLCDALDTFTNHLGVM